MLAIWNRNRTVIILLLALLVVCIGGYVIAQKPVLKVAVNAAESSRVRTTEWVDEQQCGTCHQEQNQQWKKSHHAMAMAKPSAESVRAQFDSRSFGSKQFYQKNQRYWLTAATANGEEKHYPVAYTFGWQPLQQYLVETERGRLQAFSLAWDTEKEQWFSLYPDQASEPGHPLHWQQPPHTANSQCISCHVSNYQANYDLPSDSFNSQWQALGVGCQSCHGPASAHLRWAQAPSNLALKGFNISLREAEPQLNSCAQCHSRRIELTDFTAEADVHDQFLVSPLSADLYEVDGKIQDEVFEYGSFVQSRMYQAGVTCSDCHNGHSGELRAEGNAVCSQCHNPQGQPARVGLPVEELRTQRLQGKNYNSAEHHFHASDSVGAQCTSCHMPSRTYMGNDDRHDHSFSSPNPAQAIALDHSDACLGCHQEQTAQATLAQFKQWYPNAKARDEGYATTLFMARNGLEGAAQALLAQLQEEKQPPIRLAVLLTELVNYPSDAAQQLVVRYSEHANALLRRAAIETASVLMPVVWLQGQFPRWLEDKTTAVRVVAAEQLMGLQQPLAPRLLAEYEQLQQRHLATAEAHFNLASVYQLTGREERAAEALQQALERNIDYLPAVIAWSQWLETNSPGAATQFLQAQLQRQQLQGQAGTATLHYALALSQIRQGFMPAGMKHLQQAYEQDPLNSQYAYVLAVAYYDSGAQQKALQILRTALANNPNQRHLRFVLLQYSRNSEEREKLLKDLQLINPFDPFLENSQGK